MHPELFKRSHFPLTLANFSASRVNTGSVYGQGADGQSATPQGKMEGGRAKKHFPHRQGRPWPNILALLFETGCWSKHDRWPIPKQVTWFQGALMNFVDLIWTNSLHLVKVKDNSGPLRRVNEQLKGVVANLLEECEMLIFSRSSSLSLLPLSLTPNPILS